jgi:putative membrane protein
MVNLPVEAYLYLKSAHIIVVIAWMAGLLYLPRLYVYHVKAAIGSELSETLKVMERRLLRAIMTPAMFASFLFGGLLYEAQPEGEPLQAWIIIKLLSVFGLVVTHMAFAKWRTIFAEDRNIYTEKFYRFMNEVPTVLMIIIVVCAVVKPG